MILFNVEITFSPEDILLLPSASLAERAPIPAEGKTMIKYNIRITINIKLKIIN